MGRVIAPRRMANRGNRISNTDTHHLQLDHIFASRGVDRRGTTKAMHGVDEWGSGDHCRIIINVDASPETSGA